ncbi:preprotein translocase subunit SecE [Uliginosibacterium gangwonense]|jgi:preprotein translocase subunit SecE|uniref:preprotein translocase subunit SecE n=1 Tax=Uliginosibacterium gangwonense TaxID=392736 RepID=UPI0003817439|nr:preprotein translocase subunit SecE [Uliginosibacterium gangwonense]
MADKLKFVLAVLLVAAGLAGYYLLSGQPLVLRVLCVLAGVLFGALVAWKTEQGQVFFGFARDSWVEAKKVVWPTRKETLQTTAAVFGFVVVMAIFLWASDKTVEWVLYDLILGWKR